MTAFYIGEEKGDRSCCWLFERRASACLVQFLGDQMCGTLLEVYDWPWQTIWAFGQFVGVPLTVWIAIRHPRRQEKRRQLADLVAFRNIARFSQRMLPLVAQSPSMGPSAEAHYTLALESCHRLLQQIQLDRVHPAEMSEAIARIDVATGQLRTLFERDGPTSEMKLAADEATNAMAVLDAYLENHHCPRRDDMFSAPQ